MEPSTTSLVQERCWMLVSNNFRVILSFLLTISALTLIFHYPSLTINRPHHKSTVHDVTPSEVRLSANCPPNQDLASFKNLPPKDDDLINYFKCHHLTPPSVERYNLKSYQDVPPNDNDLVTRFFRYMKTPGFYIECGANEGDISSHTIRLERQWKWSGLLIEASPTHAKLLKTKKRAAWVADVCLSPVNFASEMEFKPNALKGAVEGLQQGKLNLEMEEGQTDPDYTDPKLFGSPIQIPCFPLLTMLAAINVTHVHVFVLDIQGAEFKILKTLPWDDSLVIDFLQVEYVFDPEGPDAMQTFMESKGYHMIRKEGYDMVFLRKGFLAELIHSNIKQ